MALILSGTKYDGIYEIPEEYLENFSENCRIYFESDWQSINMILFCSEEDISIIFHKIDTI